MLFIKNSMPQIVIYKKLNFWEEYTPLYWDRKSKVEVGFQNIYSPPSRGRAGCAPPPARSFFFSQIEFSFHHPDIWKSLTLCFEYCGTGFGHPQLCNSSALSRIPSPLPISMVGLCFRLSRSNHDLFTCNLWHLVATSPPSAGTRINKDNLVLRLLVFILHIKVVLIRSWGIFKFCLFLEPLTTI